MTDPERDLIDALRALETPSPSDDLMRRIDGDALVEREFRHARAHPPVPSDILMARIARGARRTRPWLDVATWGSVAAAGLVGLMFGTGGANPFVPAGAATSYDLVPAYDFQLLTDE